VLPKATEGVLNVTLCVHMPVQHVHIAQASSAFLFAIKWDGCFYLKGV